jgi:hypothetical protein
MMAPDIAGHHFRLSYFYFILLGIIPIHLPVTIEDGQPQEQRQQKSRTLQ